MSDNEPSLQGIIDAEFAAAAGVGDLIELAQELAEHAAQVISMSELNVADPEARKRLAQAMMLCEVAAETIAKALEAHDKSGDGDKTGRFA